MCALLFILLLSAPYVLYGADDTRALLSAQQSVINQDIDDIFAPLHTPRTSYNGAALMGSASTVLAGATGLCTKVLVKKFVEHPSVRFVDPFTASAASGLASDLLKALPAALGTIATLVAGFKIYGVMKAGILSPLERKFERLKTENSEFIKHMQTHQKEYEAHTDELIAQRLEKAEEDIKDLLKDWFKQIDETNSQVIGSLSAQEKILKKLKGQVSPSLYDEIDALLHQNAQSIEKLQKMHEISPETLKKYAEKHKGNAVARFFGHLFHKKGRD